MTDLQTSKEITMATRVVLQPPPEISNVDLLAQPILQSWKEIAHYMRMGVRTVQRYEADLGLPIHRVARTHHSSVMAFRDEIDQWLLASPTRSNAFKPHDCEEFLSLLEKVHCHAARCPQCRAQVREENSIESAINAD